MGQHEFSLITNSSILSKFEGSNPYTKIAK